MKNVKNYAVVKAMLIGSASGVLGVVLLVALLKMPVEQPTEDIMVQTIQQEPVEEVETVTQVFYALQHGVFSSFDSATQFVTSYATLNKAAIVLIEGQYFVWSTMEVERADATLAIPSAFYKEVVLTSSCTIPAQLQLPKTLKDTRWLLLQEGAAADEVLLPEDWTVRTSEVLKLTTNANIVRLHLAKNYFEQLECLKMTF